MDWEGWFAEGWNPSGVKYIIQGILEDFANKLAKNRKLSKNYEWRVPIFNANTQKEFNFIKIILIREQSSGNFSFVYQQLHRRVRKNTLLNWDLLTKPSWFTLRNSNKITTNILDIFYFRLLSCIFMFNYKVWIGHFLLILYDFPF